MSVQEAIDFPRAFILENDYQFEKSIPEDILLDLKSRGHQISYSEYSLNEDLLLKFY